MPKPYSLDLRERVLKDCDAGMRSKDAATKYSVSASWVYDLRKKRRETGSIAPKKQRHGSKPKLEPYEKEVRQLVREHPDATLAEFCEMLSEHVDGAINGELFLAYVKQILLSTLSEGDIVVLNNLSSHKVAGVKEAIESVGAKVVYLPPYSPDLNPIEMVFSKLKTMLRKLKLRTMEELWKKLGKLCDIFSPEECKNYFKHAGYNEKQYSRPTPNTL